MTLVGNKAIEDAAVAFVIGLEQQAGRDPHDRRYEAAFAADLSLLNSANEPQFYEVPLSRSPTTTQHPAPRLSEMSRTGRRVASDPSLQAAQGSASPQSGLLPTETRD